LLAREAEARKRIKWGEGIEASVVQDELKLGSCLHPGALSQIGQGAQVVCGKSVGAVVSSKKTARSSPTRSSAFGWTSNIIAVVHTHPNGVDPKPAGHDLQLADRFGVPVFTITQRGMYVYDPVTRRTSMVQDGLTWLDSSRWNQYQKVAAGRTIQ
jgi:hypothetical protein